jgi:hypothetical protein
LKKYQGGGKVVDIIDYLMIAGGTYYIMTKIRDDNDDGAKRMLLGIGTGLLVGYKGPELYRKFVDMKNTTDGKMSRDKLLAAGIGAGAGYLFGDKIMNSARKVGLQKQTED